MKRFLLPLFLVAGALALGDGLRAQPAQPSPDGLLKPADNRIYAQKLVNDLMKSRHDLLSVGLHAARPGTEDYFIAAHSEELKIGKKDTVDDIAIIHGDITDVRPEFMVVSRVPRMAVHIPLRDRAGKIIGMLGLSFRRDAKTEKLACVTKRFAIASEISQKIPDASALFQPEP